MTTINQPVTVAAYYFTGSELRSFPRTIEHSGRTITFQNGLRYLVRRDQQAIKLFDMASDDGHTYRLRQDGQAWTLLGLRAGEDR